MIDVLIIGAGPAGLSAAIYVQRSGKQAVVFEALTVGGQIVNTPEIANYPGIKKTSGFEFSMGLYEQATELGAEIIYDTVTDIRVMKSGLNVTDESAVLGSDSDEGVKIDGELTGKNNIVYKVVKTASGKEYTARAVIIATGAKNRHLGLDREDELLGKGISYCATCDGAFYKGKDVAVNGGGNTALEDALFLTNYCRKVYVIHRRDSFRGDKDSVDKLKEKDNIEFVLDSTVEELKGDSSLEAVLVRNKITGDTREIPVSGLFVAIGQVPVSEAFAGVVDVDESGYIVADESCQTKIPGVFVAGDTRTKQVRQLTTAASDGAVAALAACSY